MKCGDRALAIGSRTFVMGIVNVTPDSFSDGGAFLDPQAAIDHGMRLLDDGADLLDIGGESTRPGADDVDVDTERARVLPVIEGLVARGVKNLSIDTRHAVVAAAAIGAGASWVNDVSALSDPGMLEVARQADAVVLMHARLHEDRSGYVDVVATVFQFLRERVAFAVAGGIERGRIVIDPGIGFGKELKDNLKLLKHAGSNDVDVGAVLIGASRKRFIGVLSGRDPARARDDASVGAACAAAWAGAHIVRVHAVRQTVDALRVVDAVVRC